MLNLDRDQFLTNYVSTYLATAAALRLAADHAPNKPAEMLAYVPIREAMTLAHQAWYETISQLGIPMRSL